MAVLEGRAPDPRPHCAVEVAVTPFSTPRMEAAPEPGALPGKKILCSRHRFLVYLMAIAMLAIIRWLPRFQSERRSTKEGYGDFGFNVWHVSEVTQTRPMSH